MEPDEIWKLIVKADESLKYSTAEKESVRRERAVELLLSAREEAQAAGNAELEEQATRRLRDLGADTPTT